jgi:hypothetical protein
VVTADNLCDFERDFLQFDQIREDVRPRSANAEDGPIDPNEARIGAGESPDDECGQLATRAI